MKHDEPTPTSPRIPGDLLGRYLTGECTAEEQARVERWSARSPENAELLAAIRAEVRRPDAVLPDVDAAWARLASSLTAAPADAHKRPADVRGALVPDAALVLEPALRGESAPARGTAGRPLTTRPPPPSRTAASRRSLPASLLRLAAALVVALGGIAVWRAMDRPGGDALAVALDEYAAPVGSTRQVTLADGSQVTLAPASRLQVPRDLSGAREVILDGEALFSVTHDESRPFRVLSNGNAARVLGTEFDVRTGRGADALTVAVVSGRVGVGPDDQAPAAVVEPGQMAVLDAQGALRISPADLDRILAWTRGRIELDEATLADALVELERWYDVELEVPDSGLATRRVSASFRGEPIEQVLESLTLALGARYQREGRVYRVLPSAPPR